MKKCQAGCRFGHAPFDLRVEVFLKEMSLAVARFLELAPVQRSCVILKDVLDYSLDEIAAMLDLSLSAVKAALHRGRTRLRELSKVSPPAAPRRLAAPALARYAALFPTARRLPGRCQRWQSLPRRR
jgi:Sigma-70, region 4